MDLDEFLALTHTTALVVIAEGTLVHEWYAPRVTPSGAVSRSSLVHLKFFTRS